MPISVSDKFTFDRQLWNAGNLVLVYFYATWSVPCKAIAPKLETIGEEFHRELTIIEVNVDECKDIAASHGVSEMPTFIFYKGRSRIPDCDVVGDNEAAIREQINKLKPELKLRRVY